MKHILGILALSLLVCQAHSDVSGFGLDQEYHYEYKGRVATGIAEDVKQFSGFGIKAKVIIQNQGNYVYYKFDDVEVGHINDRFHGELREELEFPYWKPKDQYAVIDENLKKPVRAVLENGLVKSFDAHPDDAEWSINIKRAVLSLFQTNFEAVNPVKFLKSNYLKHDENQNIFRVMEDGIGGECETVYEFLHQPHPQNPYARVMNVTKHRLYDKCTYRPHYFHTVLSGYKCAECEQEGNYPLKTMSTVNYQITGDRYHFTIDKIYSSGFITFTPFNTHGQSILSGVNQTLFLEEVKPIDKPQTFPSDYVTYKSLAYTFPEYHRKPEDIDLHKAHYYNRQYDFTYENYKEEAGKIFTAFVSEYKDHKGEAKDRHLSEKLISLVKAMSAFNYDDFNRFYTKYADHDMKTASPQQKVFRSVYLEVLPLIGTNPAIMHAKYLIENGKVTGEYAVNLLVPLHLYVKEPSEKLIEELYTFVQGEQIKTYPRLFSTAWMTFGSFVYKGCISSIFNPHPAHARTYLRPEVCSKYVKEMFRRFDEAQTTYERIAYLKAAKNTKLEEIYKYLRPIVESGYKDNVRHEAMWAMYQLLPKMHEEVLSIVIPIFHNYTEDYVTRIYAFEILMAAQPRPDYVIGMIDSLRREPSQQVASYMYSTFVTIANSTDPCHEKIKRPIKYVLKFLDNYDYEGFHYSRNKLFTFYNSKYNFGRTTQLSWIGSNSSFIPRNMYARHSVNLLGYNYDVLQFGLSQHGLDGVFEKLFGPDGLYSPYDQKKTVLDMFRRYPRQVNTVEKERKEIKDALHIQYREEEPMELQTFFSIMNQDIKFTYMNEDAFKTYRETGHIYLPDYFKYLKEGLPLYMRKIISFTDTVFEIPNDMGYPVILDVKIPGIMTMNGDLKAEFVPGFFQEDRNHAKPTNFHLDANLQPAVDFKISAYMGVTTQMLTTYGYGIDTEVTTKFPLKGSIDYDFTEKKLKVNYIPSTETYDMHHYKSEPYTFMYNYNKFTPIEHSEKVLPVHYLETPVEREYKVGHDYFGVGLKFSFKYDYYWNDYGSYRSFFKSFFKKSTNYDDYFYLIDRYYAGTRGFLDYALLNPTFRPFEYSVKFEPSQTSPTTEFNYVFDFDYVKPVVEPVTEEAHDDNIVGAGSRDKKTYVMHVDLIGKGPVERKWSAEFNVSYTKQYNMYRKIIFNFERSALPNYDPNPFKICYRGSAKYVDYELVTPQNFDQMKVEFNANLFFGRNCQDDKQVTLRAFADKSEEQMERWQHKEECPYYRMCEEQKKEGRRYTYACWMVKKEIERVDHFSADIEYKNLPDYFKNYTYRLSSYMRHYFYDNLEVNPFAHNPENKIRIEANFSNDYPVLDMKVYKPEENVYFHKIYFPALMPRFEPYSARENFIQKYTGKLFDYKFYPMCFVSGDYVTTFDNVTYQFPMTDCYHIVARDCSEQEKFTVMMRHMKHNTYTKSLKVFFGNYKIEVLPVGEDQSSAPLVVRVNGVKQPITEYQKYVEFHPEQKDKVIFEIYRWNNENYVVYSPVYGVKVVFDGKHSKVILSNFYRGKQCGLCGDFNGEKYHDLVGPDYCVYHDPIAYGYSYAVPESTCTVPEYTKPCDSEHAKDCMTSRNYRVYLGKGEATRKVCFTTNPLPDCRPGCKPTGLERRSAAFHCFKAQDEFTRFLVREGKTRELTELKNKSEDHHEEVEVPESCVPY